MQKIMIALSASKDFMYGMRIRPYSIATQPKGVISFTAPDEIPKELLKVWKEPDFRFGIIHYAKKLSERDIEHYSLTDLNEPTDKEKWAKFVEFADDMIEYEIEFDEFVKDFIKPNAPLKESNPLHMMKPVDFFKLLSKHGFSANLKGLEKFYNEL